MSITNQNHRRVVGLLSIGLLLLSGCKRRPTDTATTRKELLLGLSQPVRVSSGDGEAAEPAIAGSCSTSTSVRRRPLHRKECETCKDDLMKQALALLAYNWGQKLTRDLKFWPTTRTGNAPSAR